MNVTGPTGRIGVRAHTRAKEVRWCAPAILLVLTRMLGVKQIQKRRSEVVTLMSIVMDVLTQNGVNGPFGHHVPQAAERDMAVVAVVVARIPPLAVDL